MKVLINNFLLLGCILVVTSCEAQLNKLGGYGNTQIDSVHLISDSSFISKIRMLKMVKLKKRKVKVLNYMVKDTPTTEKPYYIIQVGKSNNYRLEIFYNFYCYPKTGKIKYYDTLNDTLATPASSDMSK